MMRTTVAYALIAALTLACCGKSANEKKKELDLNSEIMKVHDYSMAAIRQIKDLNTQLNAALAMHDSLAAAYPRQTAARSADDLKTAQRELAEAESTIDAWMTAHKPYDERMKHEEVMSRLTKDKEDLAKATAKALTAIEKASSALDAHKKFADEFLAKKPGKAAR